MIRRLPIGIQSFEEIRNNHYVYVDKTKYIWDLLQQGKVYFLSRPRRFGKSLFVSALAAYFQGKKELFQGLFIERKESEKGEDAWQCYPVIKFSLSGGEYQTPNGLRDRLNGIIDNYIELYDLKDQYRVRGETLAVRFVNLIERIYEKTGKQVVVLVDEYDKPLLETVDSNEEQEEKNRLLYKGFFSVLKDEDQYLKFVFFTGVTKFSKVSVFSDLNQLRDISLSNDYADICGITQDEMRTVFQPEIAAMAKEQALTEAECMQKLAQMYDGYHFSEKSTGVYNPFSLLNALQDRSFGSYWYSTGTPTFLIHKLERSTFTAEDFSDGVEATEMELTDYRNDNTNPIPLFYQTGYLTICGFDREFRVYSLKFPNREVKYGFLSSLIPDVFGRKETENPVSARNMVFDLRNGRVESFMNRLISLFAGIPYPEGQVPQYEREWRNQIFLILALLGQYVSCEVHSARGRADCVMKTDRYIYIFEFKLDKTSQEALDQIEEKGYADLYKAGSRKLYKIGVNFSTEKRNIIDWKTK